MAGTRTAAGPDPYQLVKSAVPLSQYVARLSKSPPRPHGRGKFRCPCVVHGGDNPTAMSVDDATGTWWCFTGDCGGGSIIDLHMAMNGTDAQTSLRALAAELGVAIPEGRDQRGVGVARMKAALALVAEAACDELFSGGSKDTSATRRYCRERGITKSLAESWSIGVIPPGHDAVAFALDAARDREALEAAGFLRMSESGNLWVPMNGRLLFPIRDGRGDTVGFGARAVDGVDHSLQGKYINSPESPVFSKSSMLYGLDRLDPKDPGPVVVVEGYLGAIGLDRAMDGSVTALATCGTSIADGHAALLESAPSVVVALDGDRAGLAALVRALPLANRLGDAAMAALLPPGADPWDLSLEDPDALAGMVEGEPLVQAAVRAKWSLAAGSHPDMRSWARDAASSLSYTRHRSALYQDVAVLLGVSIQSLRRDMAMPADFAAAAAKRQESPDAGLSAQGRVLLSALMAMPADTRAGSLAALVPWVGRAEAAVDNWLPLQTAMDREVLRRLALGPLDDSPASPASDTAMSSLLGDADDGGLRIMLRGIARSLLSGIAERAERPDGFLARQVKQVKGCMAAVDDHEMQPMALAYLLDLAVEMERTAALAARPKADAATGGA